jgi:PAS domain S-box-containing protein
MPRTLQNASQQDLEAIFQATPSLVLIFETDGEILIVNDAAARTFGYSADQMAGKNIFKIFNFADIPLKTRVLQLVRSHDRCSFDGIYQSRIFSCILCPIPDENGNVLRVALLAQDNADRRYAEQQVYALTQKLEHRVLDRTAQLQTENEKLRQGEKRAELLAAFSRVLAENAYNYRELLQHISDEIAQQIGDACIVGFFSGEATELQIASIAHSSHSALEKIRAALKKGAYPIQHVGLAGLMLQRENYIGEDLSNQEACDLTPPDLWPLIDKISLKALVGIPLILEERVLGGIFMARDRTTSQPYSQEDIAFLQNLAGPLALAIENARLFEEIKENNRQLSGVSQKLVKSQEDQFQRLGKELHDHIGQDLTALNITLSLIEGMLPEDSPDSLRPRLADANRLVEESVARMRNIMSDFLPPMLDRYGLTAALLWYTQKLAKRTNMPITVNDYNLRDLRLPRDVELGLFRIAQESLNNIVKHTQASRTEIELKDQNGHIIMTITDNGIGFDPRSVSSSQPEHWGLAVMRERARIIDASFTIQSAPGNGTTIILQVPRK